LTPRLNHRVIELVCGAIEDGQPTPTSAGLVSPAEGVPRLPAIAQHRGVGRGGRAPPLISLAEYAGVLGTTNGLSMALRFLPGRRPPNLVGR
jgi:hypothetical protein